MCYYASAFETHLPLQKDEEYCKYSCAPAQGYARAHSLFAINYPGRREISNASCSAKQYKKTPHPEQLHL